MSSKDNTRSGNDKKSSIFNLLKPYKGLVFLLIIFAISASTINLFIPLIISSGIDQYINGKFTVNKIILQFVFASVSIMALSYVQGLIQTYTSEKAAKDLRLTIANKISMQSYSYISLSNPSRLLTNLTSDVDSIKMFIAQAFSSIVSSVFVIIGASILLITINWKLALAVLTIIPLIGGAFFLVLNKVRPLFKKSREVIDWLNRVINESILGSMLIRILNSQHYEYIKFLEANTKSRDIGLSILNYFAALIPFINFVSNMAILVILLLGGHFVIIDKMTLGDMAAFNNYIFILIFPILIIGFMSTIIGRANASFQRVNEVLNAPEIIHKGTVNHHSLSGNIKFENVTLMYNDKPALKSIDLEIIAGSKVAIIGPTAAGKTQLLYLLTGLVKPVSGKILLDNESIESYEMSSFYKQIGLVFQDSIIFNMSIKDNISFGNSASEEIVYRAIETSELKNFIDTLPNGLDTIISERGTSLSGGQKQRIMLSRALTLNPRILLLDDFTSRVDKRTEQKIMRNVQINYPGITILSVTQKIEPIKHYEQIILLMEGEIIAAGKHSTLLNTCPEYVQIYNSQRSTSHYDLQS